MSIGIKALRELRTTPEASDGLIKLYYGDSLGSATGMTYGDYFVDTSNWDGDYYRIYRYEDSTQTSTDTLSWFVKISAATVGISNYFYIESLLGNLLGNGVLSVYYAASEPSSGTKGDVWIHTSNGKAYTYKGSAWVIQLNDWRTWDSLYYDEEHAAPQDGGAVTVTPNGASTPTITVQASPYNDGRVEAELRGNASNKIGSTYTVQLVYEAYVRILRRKPELAGLNYWVKSATDNNWSETTLTSTLYNASIDNLPDNATTPPFVQYTVVSDEAKPPQPILDTTITAEEKQPLVSTQEVVYEEVPPLNVIPIFTSLMVATTTKDSMYIKAKESLLEYFDSDDCILSEREKAVMLSELVTSLSVQATNAAMASAITIAKEDRDASYAATKIVAETKLVLEQANKAVAENLNLQKEETLLKTQIAELQLNGVADRAIKAQQVLNETDKRLTSQAARDVQGAQKSLLERQYVGFDDNKKIKAFEAQLNSWALLQSSGMIANDKLPSVVSDANLTTSYNNLTAPTV